MEQRHNRLFYWRKCRNKTMLGLAYLAVIFGLFWLVWILSTLALKGIPALSLEVFIQSTPAPNEPGGLLNAIIGSLLIVSIATLIATPNQGCVME